MTAALAVATDRKSYLFDSKHTAMRRTLWTALHGTPFRVMELEGQFLHLGTTRQFRDAMVRQSPSPAAELFQQNVLAHSAWPLAEGRRIYHSALLARDGKTGSIGPGAVVEHSILAGEASIGAVSRGPVPPPT